VKARIYGFEWRSGTPITVPDFCEHLETISGQQIENRLFAITGVEDFKVGVFLTIKDIKAFCELKNKDGHLKVVPTELDGDSKMVDVNFFLIYPETGRGLYLHYHQSASANTFSSFCRREYNRLKNNIIEQEICEAGGEDIPDHRAKAIRRRYNGTLFYSTLVKPEAFEECVRQLNKIKSFAFELSSIEEEERNFAALPSHASRATHTVFFTAKNQDTRKSEEIKNAIIDYVRRNNFKKANVVGIDDLGEIDTVKLLKDYACFEEFDYDEIVKSMTIDIENIVESIKGSDIIGELLRAANRDDIRPVLTTPAR